jgi:hypothetical protein
LHPLPLQYCVSSSKSYARCLPPHVNPADQRRNW